MTRLTALFLAFLLVAGGALLAFTKHSVDRDRRELIERFGAGHLERLVAAAGDVEGSLDDVADDLELASRLVAASGSSEERRHLLTALIGSESAYLAATVYSGGAPPHVVTAPRLAEAEVPQAIVEAMRDTALRSLELEGGKIEVTTPVEGEEASWFRVFATPLPVTEPGAEPGALALLVNTRAFFEKLRVVAAGQSSELFLLGARGEPAPISSERLKAAIIHTDPQLLPITRRTLGEMREGQTGTAVLGVKEAELLGFEPAEVTVAYAPIRLSGATHWSAAVLASLSSIRSHEEALISRLVLGSSAFGAVLLGLAAYVLISSRRSAVLRERLRHANEMAHLREMAEKVLENIPSGVMVLSEDGKITALNQALRERVPEAASAGEIEQAFPRAEAAALERVRRLLQQARNDAKTTSALGERLALFGEEGQYNLHAVPLEPHSSEARLLLVIEDFTEVSALQSQLLRAEKLATVGILAAGIAHEIGTPLGVIRGRAEYTIGKLGGESAHAPGLKVIVEQIDRVSRTIRELLDFSRVKMGATVPVELGPEVQKAVELLEFEAKKRSLVIETQLSGELPALIADPDQLQQVLVNLLINAFDASPDRGTVRISAVRDNAGAVRLEIADEGSGIPAENVHRVFDPFFTTKKRGQGTGLGLTIVSQIVRGHGARIELDSKQGRGTKVVVIWPSVRTTEERARAV